MTIYQAKLARAAALALVGLGGCPETDAAGAFEIFDEALPHGRQPASMMPVDVEWSESPRHTDSIRLSGSYGITLTVDYEDSNGRKETVKSFHRLSIQKDGFEIISEGQSTKFPFNGRMSKTFEATQRSTLMNCFTLSTSNRIALECTIATKTEDCLGDFVWRLFVHFDSAGKCTKVTTEQTGGHICNGKKDQAAFHSTAFECSRLAH